MKTGITYWGIGREKQREHIRGEREAALVERGKVMARNDCW